MTRIYFIRHGKTEWNLESKYQGAHGDSPLLPESYHEIKLLAASLKSVPITHVFSSPLPRAKTTAQKLIESLDQSIPLTIDPRLAEFDLGLMEGMKFSAVAQRWPEVLNNFRHHPDKYDPEIVKSESFESVIARVGSAVHSYVEQFPNDNIMVVSHGAALNAAINGLLKVPMNHLKDRGGLSNTSTTILQTSDGINYQLEKWNDTSYLHKTSVDPTDTI
ncbi:histidine phosphatase family protein [uncultured Limosilactobacillus sp.]|uniref:histidine phosphatase family protein n=1 Tax=uncultured Limosilactobacillus sp. TaxID=2837629 RepID=UPI0025F6B259|nr:histidine phosphatase family protein [uncultured Limosilactobacillus sp.]